MESQKNTQTKIEGRVSAPGAQPKNEQITNQIDQPAEQKEQPTTGIPHLDWLLGQRISFETEAAIYACLHICRQNPKLANAIEAVIRPDIQPFIEGKRHDPELDTECDILPMIEWLSLLCGFEAASRQPEQLSKVSMFIDEQFQSEKRCTEDKAGPELKGIVRWLLNRNHTEKLTAVLIWQLLSKESEYKKEEMYQGSISNDIDKYYQNEILLASQNSELLKQFSPEDIAVTAFTAALIPISV